MKWFYTFLSIILFICALLIINRLIEKKYFLPKIIWFYWDTEIPLLIQQIKDYNRRALEGWDIRFLNEKTLGDYIKPWDFPTGYDTLIPQHKADWIRAFLLSRHGGCWCDASIILNSKKALNDLWEESIQIQSEFTGFYTYYTENKLVKGIPTNIENWFFMVPQNSRIMRLWYEEYTGAIKEGFVTYRNRILKEGINLDYYYSKGITDNVYFTQHFCMQAILQRSKVINPMILKSSGDTMFKLHKECKEEEKVRTYVMNLFLHNPSYVRKIPYVKLTRYERETGIDISPYFK